MGRLEKKSMIYLQICLPVTPLLAFVLIQALSAQAQKVGEYGEAPHYWLTLKQACLIYHHRADAVQGTDAVQGPRALLKRVLLVLVFARLV